MKIYRQRIDECSAARSRAKREVSAMTRRSNEHEATCVASASGNKAERVKN
jgi:hypothetical protein